MSVSVGCYALSGRADYSSRVVHTECGVSECVRETLTMRIP
jgi:hypothetical protein